VSAGEVIFIIAVNCIIIFVLYRFQQQSLEKRVKHLKNEIQDLEDLVAAIIEEFQEIAAVTEARANDTKKAILESTPVIESDQVLAENAATHPYDEMKGIETTVDMRPEIKNLESAPYPIPKAFSVGEPEVMNHQPSSGRNTRPATDLKHQHILELWEKGLSIEEIAKNLGTGRGEVQLILGIYRRS
jgi:hypothetical protein